MKLVCLLLLTLLGPASAPQPPAVQVAFAPLTKAAYLAAQKSCVTTRPRVTFPLKKQRGRIVIPTAKGKKVFADVVARGECGNITYTYWGYWPTLRCHVVRVQQCGIVHWFLTTEAGQQLELQGELLEVAPDGQYIASACPNLSLGGPPNNIQLLALQQDTLREVWHLEPKEWEPVAVCWLSPTTLLLRKRMWTSRNPGTTYTYARLTIR
ncbi:MAG: hypothetical protein ACRYFX_09125 [Janthinobacterium lividum]